MTRHTYLEVTAQTGREQETVLPALNEGLGRAVQWLNFLPYRHSFPSFAAEFPSRRRIDRTKPSSSFGSIFPPLLDFVSTVRNIFNFSRQIHPRYSQDSATHSYCRSSVCSQQCRLQKPPRHYQPHLWLRLPALIRSDAVKLSSNSWQRTPH